MKRNHRTKAALLILGLSVVLLCLLAWLTWREVRQSRLNHALILALQQPVQVPILVDARLLEGAGDVPPPGPG